jgi:hypothetical protein
MKHLAAALALAIHYLEERSPTCTEDDDVEALEGIATELEQATSEERQSLIAALLSIGRADLVEGFGLDDPTTNS